MTHFLATLGKKSHTLNNFQAKMMNLAFQTSQGNKLC